MKNIIVIGSGFAGMSAACFLAKAGANVTVIEKNSQAGGRASVYRQEGFTFDMGPSWYWMPDVFERFFAQFGKRPSDYYDLIRLDPSYRVIWEDETVDISATYGELQNLFEGYEQGAGKKLDIFLKEAAYKYEAGINNLVYKPSLSFTEFMRWDVLSALPRIDLLQSIHSHLRKYFTHPKLLQLAEFPILFLGALPQNTPALYSLMNYADMKLGTWYPMGGMYKISEAMYQLAVELGVQFQFDEAAVSIEVNGDEANKVVTEKGEYECDEVIAACDYHHAEQKLLPEQYRNYTETYWDKRTMAPSCLLYYIGLNKKVDGLEHHNLFFDAPFDAHAAALYTKPEWPENPLMYVCCPSKTDSTVAPEGCENLFVLIPVAPDMQDSETIKEKYFDIAINKIEQRTGQKIREHIIVKRSYAHSNFIADYNAYKGNAYGLANTRKQTAFLKPSIRNKKVSNLYYTGLLTVPGPGVPPALISGEVVARQITKSFTPKAVAYDVSVP